MNRSRSRSSRALSKTISRSRIFTVRNVFAVIAIVLILYVILYTIWYFFHETDTGRSMMISMGYLPSPNQKMIQEVNKGIPRNREGPNKISVPLDIDTPSGKSVMLMGQRVHCSMITPCKDLKTKPPGGCCPDGIKGNDGVPGNCELGAEDRKSPDYLRALRECGYSV